MPPVRSGAGLCWPRPAGRAGGVGCHRCSSDTSTARLEPQKRPVPSPGGWSPSPRCGQGWSLARPLSWAWGRLPPPRALPLCVCDLTSSSLVLWDQGLRPVPGHFVFIVSSEPPFPNPAHSALLGSGLHPVTLGDPAAHPIPASEAEELSVTRCGPVVVAGVGWLQPSTQPAWPSDRQHVAPAVPRGLVPKVCVLGAHVCCTHVHTDCPPQVPSPAPAPTPDVPLADELTLEEVLTGPIHPEDTHEQKSWCSGAVVQTPAWSCQGQACDQLTTVPRGNSSLWMPLVWGCPRPPPPQATTALWDGAGGRPPGCSPALGGVKGRSRSPHTEVPSPCPAHPERAPPLPPHPSSQGAAICHPLPVPRVSFGGGGWGNQPPVAPMGCIDLHS